MTTELEATSNEDMSAEQPTETTEAPKNELADFRAARESERSGEESVDVEAAAPEPDTPDVPQENQIMDPDTGDVLDRRSRSAKRIESLLRERHELRQQLVNKQAQPATEMPQQEAPQEAPPAQDEAPTIEQFVDQADPYAAFLAANSRWEARQEYQKQHQAQQAADRTAHAHVQIQQAQQEWDGKLDEVRKRHPDFDQAYTNMYETLPTDGKQRPLVETLLTSPIGHELVHHLGTHPEVIQELYQQPTLKAHLRAIGKLEARVESGLPQSGSPALTHVKTPPPPMNPVEGATTPAHYNSSTATLAQFRKYNGVRGGRRNV